VMGEQPLRFGERSGDGRRGRGEQSQATVCKVESDNYLIIALELRSSRTHVGVNMRAIRHTHVCKGGGARGWAGGRSFLGWRCE
jgi:hypothetical protein